jgi:hypothetical protein
MTIHFSHKETDDRYHAEIVRHGRFRIVKSGAGGRWQALGYFLTRDALIRLWTALDCPVGLELIELPTVFRRGKHG